VAWRSDIDANLLGACLYTEPDTEPELLVRTSGETRLSDFLLYQVTARHDRVLALYHSKSYYDGNGLLRNHFV
jgi:undecaprenyl diphosphate synthase